MKISTNGSIALHFILNPFLPSLLIFSLQLAGCGGGGSNSPSGNGASSGSATPSSFQNVSGVVTDGPVAGATVSFYQLQADGSKGAPIVTVTTASDGSYSASLPPGPGTGVVLVEAAGGEFHDDANNSMATLTNATPLQALVSPSTSFVAITPLTTIAATLGLQRIKSGAQAATAADQANNEIAGYVGLDNIVSTLPISITSSSSASASSKAYGLALSALSKEAQSAGLDSASLLSALVKDASDGKIDGLSDGAVISLRAAQTVPQILSGTELSSMLRARMQDIVTSAENTSGAAVPAMQDPHEVETLVLHQQGLKILTVEVTGPGFGEVYIPPLTWPSTSSGRYPNFFRCSDGVCYVGVPKDQTVYLATLFAEPHETATYTDATFSGRPCLPDQNSNECPIVMSEDKSVKVFISGALDGAYIFTFTPTPCDPTSTALCSQQLPTWAHGFSEVITFDGDTPQNSISYHVDSSAESDAILGGLVGDNGAVQIIMQADKLAAGASCNLIPNPDGISPVTLSLVPLDSSQHTLSPPDGVYAYGSGIFRCDVSNGVGSDTRTTISGGWSAERIGPRQQ